MKKTLLSICVSLVILAFAGCGLVKGPEVVAYFKDAKMLQKGDAVAQNGIVIGKVESIEHHGDEGVAVTMVIDKKHMEATRRDSLAFIVADPGQRPRVDLYPLASSTVPLADNDRIPGVETQLELQYRRAAAALGPAMSSLRERADQAIENVNDYLESPEGKELSADTKQFLRDARDRVGEGIEDARESYPDFEKRLGEQMAKAKREGNEMLVKMLEVLEQSLSDSPPAQETP